MEWMARRRRLYVLFALDEPARFDACFVLRTGVERRFPRDFRAGKSPVGSMIVARVQAAQAAGVRSRPIRSRSPWCSGRSCTGSRSCTGAGGWPCRAVRSSRWRRAMWKSCSRVTARKQSSDGGEAMNWRGNPWFGVFCGRLSPADCSCVSLDVGPWGPLALLAPIPLLIYALSAPRAWTVALAAATARVAIGLGGVVYVYDDFPLAALLAFVAVFSLIYAGVVLLDAAGWRGLHRSRLAVFSYPLLLVTAEFLFGLVSPHGSFGAMGYSLVDVLPLLQAASVGGVAALTFCVALVPMTVAVAMARPQLWRAARRSPVLLPMVLITGVRRTAAHESYESRTRVALVGLDAYEGARLSRRGRELSKRRARLPSRCTSSRSDKPNSSSRRKNS